MKRLLIISSAAIIMLSGCATDLPSAIAALSDAAIAGALTYEQIAALKAAAKAEQGSVEAPEPGVVDPADCPPGTPPPVAAPQKPVVPTSGMASAVMLGADTCSHTRKFLALDPQTAVESALPWVDFVYADRVKNAATYQAYRPREGFSFPLVRVFDSSGVFRGEFVARSITLADTIARVKTLVGD